MMKKSIVSMVLAIGLIASPVMASEQSTIDYDSMSTEELVALRDEINAQIADRGGDNVIGQGVYEVGVDIKATNFKVICNDEKYVNFYIYDNKEKYQSYDVDSQLLVYNDDDGGGVLNLKEGQIVSLTNGSAIIEEIKPSWAPEE